MLTTLLTIAMVRVTHHEHAVPAARGAFGYRVGTSSSCVASDSSLLLTNKALIDEYTDKPF